MAVQPILANEKNAARLLDMTVAEFRSLVRAGHLPAGRELVPGFIRWNVDDLRRIASGDAIDSMDGVKW